MTLKQKIQLGYIRANLRILSVISKKRAAAKALKLFCTPFDSEKYPTSPLFETAEILKFSIDNKNVVGYRWNHPQPKKLLIIHGFQSRAKKFDPYISVMMKKGYEVLAFDAHAHGESEGKQTNVLEYKKMIETIDNKYGPINAYMAHSFGGLAVSLALEDIRHTEQTRLVLIAPVTETSSSVDQLFGFLRLKASLRKVFESLILSIGGKPVAWLSVSRAITNIKARVLWIHDEDDDITPLKDVQPLLNAHLPHVKFMITKGWGHRRIYREEKVIQAISDFL